MTAHGGGWGGGQLDTAPGGDFGALPPRTRRSNLASQQAQVQPRAKRKGSVTLLVPRKNRTGLGNNDGVDCLA